MRLRSTAGFPKTIIVAVGNDRLTTPAGQNAQKTLCCTAVRIRTSHVEAAVAAECDDLARAVEGLDAIGLTERGADGAIVEGANDPLLAFWRIQLPDQSVMSPVSKTHTALRAARSLTARATACG